MVLESLQFDGSPSQVDSFTSLDSRTPTQAMECTSVTNESLLAECLEHRGWYDVCQGDCVYEEAHRLSGNPALEERIYGKIFPILVIFVIVANVMVALVLSKRHMVTPTNVVLKYMAIADLFVGLTPLPWTMFYFTFRNFENSQMELWWCYVQKYSMDAFPPIFHNIAMWLTVLLAGQRFISISYPMYSRSLCNVSNVRICTFVIGAVSLVCGLPKSIDYNIGLFDGWVITQPNETAHHLRTCYLTPTTIVRKLGEDVYFSTYFWTRSILFVIVPCTLLIVLNAGLIRGIRKAQQRKERLLREKRSRDAQRQTDSNSTSIMLVVIVTIFLMVNLPQAIFMVIMCVEQTFPNIFEESLLNTQYTLIFLIVNNMLVMATYPINFAIYCFMSSSFRQTFRAMFCSSCLRGEQESAAFATKMENSAVPLVKFVPEDTLNTCDENSIYRRDRRNDSVFL